MKLIRPFFFMISSIWGPNVPLSSYVCQISEQCFVGLTGTRTRDVIGMHDEADQAVLLHDFIDLPLPQLNRIIIKNVKQRVVLDRSHGQFQYLSHEKRHDRAASSALRV